jgi:hypothetical protein
MDYNEERIRNELAQRHIQVSRTWLRSIINRVSEMFCRSVFHLISTYNLRLQKPAGVCTSRYVYAQWLHADLCAIIGNAADCATTMNTLAHLDSAVDMQSCSASCVVVHRPIAVQIMHIRDTSVSAYARARQLLGVADDGNEQDNATQVR